MFPLPGHLTYKANNCNLYDLVMSITYCNAHGVFKVLMFHDPNFNRFSSICGLSFYQSRFKAFFFFFFGVFLHWTRGLAHRGNLPTWRSLSLLRPGDDYCSTQHLGNHRFRENRIYKFETYHAY